MSIDDIKHRPGRPSGSINKISRMLKEGLIQAAIDSELGHDSKDPNAAPSLNRYLTNFANKYETEFFVALTKLIPKSQETRVQSDTTVDISLSRTADDVRREMQSIGMTQREIQQIEQILLPEKLVHSETVDISHLMEPENDENR